MKAASLEPIPKDQEEPRYLRLGRAKLRGVGLLLSLTPPLLALTFLFTISGWSVRETTGVLVTVAIGVTLIGSVLFLLKHRWAQIWDRSVHGADALITRDEIQRGLIPPNDRTRALIADPVASPKFAAATAQLLKYLSTPLIVTSLGLAGLVVDAAVASPSDPARTAAPAERRTDPSRRLVAQTLVAAARELEPFPELKQIRTELLNRGELPKKVDSGWSRPARAARSRAARLLGAREISPKFSTQDALSQTSHSSEPPEALTTEELPDGATGRSLNRGQAAYDSSRKTGGNASAAAQKGADPAPSETEEDAKPLALEGDGVGEELEQLDLQGLSSLQTRREWLELLGRPEIEPHWLPAIRRYLEGPPTEESR